MPTQKIYYQPQYDWTEKEFSALFYILNKAILDEQEWLEKLNTKLLYNSTKAILKGLIAYYGKSGIYEKFPNLAGLSDQKPLFVGVEIGGNLNIPELTEMGVAV